MQYGILIYGARYLVPVDAVLESVVVLCMTSRAMAVVVVPFGFAKAGFFSVCPVVLGVAAAAERGT